MLHLHSREYQGSTCPAPGIEPISMRIVDACHFTGLSRSTLYILIGEGRIKIAKVGRSTLVLTDSLKSFLSEAVTTKGSA